MAAALVPNGREAQDYARGPRAQTFQRVGCPIVVVCCSLFLFVGVGVDVVAVVGNVVIVVNVVVVVVVVVVNVVVVVFSFLY